MNTHRFFTLPSGKLFYEADRAWEPWTRSESTTDSVALSAALPKDNSIWPPPRSTCPISRSASTHSGASGDAGGRGLCRHARSEARKYLVRGAEAAVDRSVAAAEQRQREPAFYLLMHRDSPQRERINRKFLETAVRGAGGRVAGVTR